MTDNNRDWREWAYLRKENWPEAIPNCGPKREYGPYPWGKKTHDDPHDVDDYPSSHPQAASVGDTYMGDVCPWCGIPLDMMETVVLITGEKGEFIEVDEIDNPTPAYHSACWKQRVEEIGQIENTTLDDWDEE